MTTRAKLIVSWVGVALWAAFIFFMSAHTGADLDTGTGLVADLKRWLVSLATPLFGPDTDIVSVAGHFAEYLVFGVLLFHALWRSAPQQRWWLLVIAAVAMASFYGVTDEFHQSFVPGRLCDPADWLTDTVGAAIGALGAGAVLCRHGHSA